MKLNLDEKQLMEEIRDSVGGTIRDIFHQKEISFIIENNKWVSLMILAGDTQQLTNAITTRVYSRLVNGKDKYVPRPDIRPEIKYEDG